VTQPSFVHLRCHSSYSLSEGAIKAEKLAALARAEAMPAVAITDTGNLFGALEFSQACVAKGVQPVIGCQVALRREAGCDPVVLLAQNETGFANLQRLSSRGFMDSNGERPSVTMDVLCGHAEGLLLLTGNAEGPLGRPLAEGQRATAASWLARAAEAFPGRTVVELQRHGTAVEQAIEPGLIALADEAGLPLAATNECFFAAPSMHAAHDALLCIAEGRTLVEPARRRVTQEHWFKPAAAMRTLFADLPEACDNTLALARRCAVMAEKRSPLLPVCPKVRPGSTETETLRAMAQEGLHLRMQASGADAATAARYRERLDFELGVIGSMGFSGYFLIVADFIQWARAQGIPVGPGRGSGAGSVVAWALTVTDIDPLPWGLLFERFLNPERVSMPDFDIDFCQDRRDEVIAYVRREYGADRVAQIITFGKLQARAAVRDVGRVLAMPFGQVNRVAELIPNNPAKPVTLQEAIDGEPRLRLLRDEDESVRSLLDTALQLEGLYRHASTHAAGVVIGDRPLIDMVPIYRDPRSGDLVTQYSMKYVEQAGLVKFDFLGLTTLTILKRAVDLLRDQGNEVALDRVPLDDPATYAMLARGDAGGVFQFESAGMRDVLRQMRPDRFEDLIAGVALYRPGPMANIPEYCRRKHGEAWAAPHPELHDILAETYGIMIYQEQVMQIAQRMAGYSLGAADLLRRAMGKKIRSEMDAQRRTFIDGATARGIAAAKAEEVFELMARFADYGFNKSHAAAYALVAYHTAWMKANHPVAFFAGCMSMAIGNTDRLSALRRDALTAGIALLPPDINRSSADFAVERLADGTLAIRYALAALKRVGRPAMEAVVAARGTAAFASLADFAARVDPRQLNRMAMESLARAGAFDPLEPDRARVFAGAETVLRRAQAHAEEKGSGQVALFAGAGQAQDLRLPEAASWTEMERLAAEAEAVGFHLTAHPLDAYATALRRLGVISSTEIAARAASGIERVRLAGLVVASKERSTRSGGRMAWLRLSDAAGGFEITLFSEVLGRAREVIVAGAPIVATVDIRQEGDAVRLTATDVRGLDAAAAETGVGMRIWLARTEAVPHIRALLTREGRGSGRVVLLPRLPEAESVEVTLPGSWNVSPRLAQAMKMVAGVERVEEA
jgi:DNA polymerase-3 subunit alpha